MNLEEILERKLLALYSEESIRLKAKTLLRSCEDADLAYDPLRVQLAILKQLDDKATLEQLGEVVRMAMIDPRDVIALAEYPRQMRTRSRLNDVQKKEIVAADRQEYEHWLRL